MQLTRPDCDCEYLGASFRAINRPIALDIGRADYSFADSRRADIAEISPIVSRAFSRVLQAEKMELYLRGKMEGSKKDRKNARVHLSLAE